MATIDDSEYVEAPQAGDNTLITRRLELGSIKMFDPAQSEDQWIASTHSAEDLGIGQR